MLLRDAPCSTQEPDAFKKARASTKRNGVAALLTEFGATDDDRTHVFRMTWRASRDTTFIVLPKAHFPRGIGQSLTGGGSKVLTVQTRRGLEVRALAAA